MSESVYHGLGTPGLGTPGLGTPGLGTPGPGTPILGVFPVWERQSGGPRARGPLRLGDPKGWRPLPRCVSCNDWRLAFDLQLGHPLNQ